jgi:superfamily I DNA and/or RNA helicase
LCSSNYKGNEAILNSKAYTFFNIQGRERQASSGSYYNQIEAQAIANIVQQIQRKTRLDRSSTPWYSSRKIRIITFYQAQVSCLRQCLNERGAEKVLVATVDSSQGCEADIVILSFVRSNQRAGFLRDDRRMNVALTRAKYQLICVGDVTGTLSVTGVNTLDALIADAKKRDVIRDFDHREESSTGPLRTRRYRR